MMKAKIMLFSIVILSVLGAALAFKVKMVGATSYCYSITEFQPPDGECPLGIANALAIPFGSGGKIYYTITTDPNNCCQNPILSCPNEAHLPFGL